MLNAMYLSIYDSERCGAVSSELPRFKNDDVSCDSVIEFY